MPKNDDGCRFCSRDISCEDCERLKQEYGEGMFAYVADVILGPRASANRIQEALIIQKRKGSDFENFARK